MSIFAELNQANNRNGDLLTEISRLQHENDKIRAQLNEWLEWDANCDRIPRPRNDIRPDAKGPAMRYITEQQIDAAHAAYDEEERNVHGGTIADCLRAAIQAALVQSDANPVRDFAKAVLHGDDDHKAWLLEAAEAFIEGKPLPAPRGKGTQSGAEPVAWR